MGSGHLHCVWNISQHSQQQLNFRDVHTYAQYNTYTCYIGTSVVKTNSIVSIFVQCPSLSPPFVQHPPNARTLYPWTRNEWPSFWNDYPNLSRRGPKHLCTKTCSFCVRIINIVHTIYRGSTMTWPQQKGCSEF